MNRQNVDSPGERLDRSRIPVWLPTSNRQFSRTDASASMWSDRNLEKFALQDRHCIAAQNDSIGFNSDMDNPTSFGRLIAGDRRFAQSPRPVRTETAVCRARHGILIYSSCRRKESRDEVETRVVRGAGNNHTAYTPDIAQCMSVCTSAHRSSFESERTHHDLRSLESRECELMPVWRGHIARLPWPE